MGLALRKFAGVRKGVDSGPGLMLHPARHAVERRAAALRASGFGGAGGLAQANSGMWRRAALARLVHASLQTDWEDWGVITRLHDPNDYTGTAAHYFEAVLKSSGALPAVKARLYNITLAEPVAGSTVATPSPTAVRVRSPGFTLPAGDNEYKAQIGEPA